MTTFVLVHGAWHGGWCWKRVTPLLRAAGHDVFTPTLTGLGERAHLSSPEIGLATHVEDVAALIRSEELTDVVLVGHSYAGLVIAGVAEHVGERLRHLVFFDSFVPHHGVSLLDLAPPRPGGAADLAQREGPRAQYLPPGTMEFLGVSDPEDIAWLNRHLAPHPMKCFTDKSEQPANVMGRLPKTFIFCTVGRRGQFSRGANIARSEPGWQYREIDTGHDAMVTAPGALADLFLEAAQ